MTALVLPGRRLGAWLRRSPRAGYCGNQSPYLFVTESLEPAPLITFVNRSCRVQRGHAGQPDTDFCGLLSFGGNHESQAMAHGRDGCLTR
jgi:hypothetical protein